MPVTDIHIIIIIIIIIANIIKISWQSNKSELYLLLM